MLSKNQEDYLLGVARSSIARALGMTHTVLQIPEPLNLNAPCFVTLMEKTGQLRGCIGTLESPEPLIENVKHYARLAAFEDPRFGPLEASEFSNIRIGISVLGPMIPLKDFGQIVVGKHGLFVTHLKKHGVLLAKVAVESGWNREQFISHTCEKARLDPKDFESYTWSTFEEESFEE